jgi:hypothetical protein
MSSIVSWRTEQEIRNRKQETGNRKQNRKKDIKKGYELRLTFLSSIVSGRTVQEIRDRKQETGKRKQETGKRKQNRKKDRKRHRERMRTEANLHVLRCLREDGTGNKEQEARDRG